MRSYHTLSTLSPSNFKNNEIYVWILLNSTELICVLIIIEILLNHFAKSDNVIWNLNSNHYFTHLC